MDAAQRLLKNSAILAATALLMATVGLAQPTLNVATSVTMAGTGGQDVSVTSSGSPTTEITYAIGAPSYAADGGGSWLGVTGGTTTPASLSFSLARAPLTGGIHSAGRAALSRAGTGAAFPGSRRIVWGNRDRHPAHAVAGIFHHPQRA